MNPFLHFWSFPFQPWNFFPDPSCPEIWLLRREAQTQPIVFGTSAVFRLRNFPFEKLPFAPDLNLSNYGPKSYFRPFISHLVESMLTDFQPDSKFSTKNFPTTFPQIKSLRNTGYPPSSRELCTFFKIIFQKDDFYQHFDCPPFFSLCVFNYFDNSSNSQFPKWPEEDLLSNNQPSSPEAYGFPQLSFMPDNKLHQAIESAWHWLEPIIWASEFCVIISLLLKWTA